MPATDLQNANEIDNLKDTTIALDFWAEWAKPCSQMNAVFDQLADTYSNIKFIKVDAEKFSDVTEKYEVTVVPCFLFLRNGNILSKIEGANSPELASKAQFFASVKDKPASTESSSTNTNTNTSEVKEDLNTRLKKLINSAPVMLFMKGTPSQPQCGFSSKIVNILNEEKIDFGSFNILSDEEVRTGLKTYSNWPTYPQLYAQGKLIGGLDIVKELREEGQLQDAIKEQ